MNIRTVLSSIWSELSLADGYSHDWYGYVRNQLAHFALGLSMASLASVIHFTVFGEFAQKGALWFAIGVFYATFELGKQGWHGRDTVEDWVFFVIYGAGIPIILFNEVSPGSPILSLNSQMILPVFAIMFCHLGGGIIARVIRKIKANEG